MDSLNNDPANSRPVWGRCWGRCASEALKRRERANKGLKAGALATLSLARARDRKLGQKPSRTNRILLEQPSEKQRNTERRQGTENKGLKRGALATSSLARETGDPPFRDRRTDGRLTSYLAQ